MNGYSHSDVRVETPQGVPSSHLQNATKAPYILVASQPRWRARDITGRRQQRSLLDRNYPSPERAAISTPARMAPNQRISERNAATLAAAGITGERFHLGTFHCTITAKMNANRIVSIFTRKGVSKA